LPLLLCLFPVATAQEGHFWPRWEERTIDCLGGPTLEDCVLKAPGAAKERNPADYKCREEPMPQWDFNELARNSTTRIACPIGCEPDADLSVLQKVPYNNAKCQKYYTYGKYREAGEWYLWMTEPCRAAITTHCRFKDVKIG
ncbi:hypothetical protein PFISCL1PPCAC_14248, partial [Pristionchus fissidentatus]